MKSKRSLETVGGILLLITMTLVLATGVWAASGYRYKTLHEFTNKDGSNPYGSMILDEAGNLYGTTNEGGAHGYGTVFRLTHQSNGSWTESVLYSFCSLTNCIDGNFPQGALVFDGAGNLYGAAGGGVYGAGAAYRLTPRPEGEWREEVLYNFCPDRTRCPDGQGPAGLTIDQAGNLYGTTYYGGGTGNRGTVFKLTHKYGKWTESVLFRFGGKNGAHPAAGVILDSGGNLYGTTSEGGAADCNYPGCGVAFKLSPSSDGWAESVLYSFCSSTGCPDGAYPSGPVVLDAAGELYGTAGEGGAYEQGVAFSLTPNQNGSWTESVLHKFTRKGGRGPVGGMVFDLTGNLYGVTTEGGTVNDYCARGCGVVYKLATNSSGGWNEAVLYRFSGPIAFPEAGVTLDTAGNLYGTTSGNGEATFGSVFEIMP